MKYVIIRDPFVKKMAEIERFDFFAAHDYNVQKEAVRIFWVKGKNKVDRAIAFIKKAWEDGLTVESFNSYGEDVQVLELVV